VNELARLLPPPRSTRSSALLFAIRQRFPGFPSSEAFDAWNAAQARDEPRRFLTKALLTDINRGHTPTPHHVSALAAAAGWTFERVCRELGIDLAQLARLQAALGIDDTHVDSDRDACEGSFQLPTAIAPHARRDVNERLDELVVDWRPSRARRWTSDADARYITGHIGRTDNIAYPRLPSGAAVVIDRRDTNPGAQGGYYAVEHPNGCSCGFATVREGILTLRSERREWYPPLSYPVGHVRVHGRVTAFAGRVDRMRPPPAVSASDLLHEQRALLDRTRLRDLPAPLLLRELLVRQRLTRSRFERKVRILRRLAGPRFTMSRGLLSGLMQQQSSPRLITLYALAAILRIQPRDLFNAYGLSIDPPSQDPASHNAHEPVPGMDPTQAEMSPIRSHDFVEHLSQDGWDLPWLCALPRPRGWWLRPYYLGDPGQYLGPLLAPEAFVVVNTRQRRVLTRLHGRPVSELEDWRRPIYLLQTMSRRRYVCGYVEDHGATLHIVPHPMAPCRRPLILRQPDEAVVVGHVTQVATRLR
jgi:transcriptional regulator with XRE-family HTH domain